MGRIASWPPQIRRRFGGATPRLTCGGLVLMGALLLTTVPGNAAAQSPSSAPPCGTSFSPYAYAPAALASCGIVTYPLVSETRLSDGGTQYTYSVPGARETESFPPVGFDAATASPAELQQYGIPLEPTNAALQPAWLAMVQHLHFVQPATFIASIPITADGTSGNWAGYIDYGGSGSYTTASSTWGEEYLYSSRCSSASVVTWTGIGGATGTTLAQDGTGLDTPDLGYNQAFTEVYPAQNIQPLGFYATSGYPFTAYVQYDGGNTYYFYVYNAATGSATSRQVTAGSYSGNSAESIVERPKVGTSFANLANFGTMTFTSSTANGQPIGADSNLEAVEMENFSDGHILAVPSGLSAGGAQFSVTQKMCN